MPRKNLHDRLLQECSQLFETRQDQFKVWVRFFYDNSPVVGRIVVYHVLNGTNLVEVAVLVGIEPAKEQVETILLHTVACGTDIEQHTAIGTEELFSNNKSPSAS